MEYNSPVQFQIKAYNASGMTEKIIDLAPVSYQPQSVLLNNDKKPSKPEIKATNISVYKQGQYSMCSFDIEYSTQKAKDIELILRSYGGTTLNNGSSIVSTVIEPLKNSVGKYPIQYIYPFEEENEDETFQIRTRNEYGITLSDEYSVKELMNKYLSIEDKQEAQIAYYPNPFGDLLFIHGSISDITTIIVRDMSGREVAKIHSPQSNSLNLSHLPKGIYLLETYHRDNQKRTMIKLIKNK